MIDWQHDFVHLVLVLLTVLMAVGVAKDLVLMAWRLRGGVDQAVVERRQ
ncbi:MAG TPA: hypothetical protein VMV69_22075 [Pirellulales bacterium]|nr:hypothetical protein [Pirellulales bacterium]